MAEGPGAKAMVLRPLRWLRDVRIGPLRAAVAMIALLIVGTVTWIAFHRDPLGGEPVVVVAIDPPAGAGGADSSSFGDLGIRDGLNSGDAVPERVAEGQQSGGEEPGAAVRQRDTTRALPPVPAKGLVESGRFGAIPRIGADGRRPSRVYARPAPPPPPGVQKPARIAILVGGMGLSASGTDAAIERLPADVTLAFAPYPKDLQRWINRARDDGHEVMLQIPMEPYDYPDNDPGPYTLLSELTPKDNLQRLEWLMSRFIGYFGVTNYMGAKFKAQADALRPLLKQLSGRGLVFVEDTASASSRVGEVAQDVGLGFVAADVTIDAEQTPEAIDKALDTLERIALERGLAIGVGSGLPVTVDRLAQWARALATRDILLVPVSSTLPAGQT